MLDKNSLDCKSNVQKGYCHMLYLSHPRTNIKHSVAMHIHRKNIAQNVRYCLLYQHEYENLRFTARLIARPWSLGTWSRSWYLETGVSKCRQSDWREVHCVAATSAVSPLDSPRLRSNN
jgi:hypothetical protein